MSLGEFLKAAASDRGPWNCSTLAADWCVSLGYPDFAAQWRAVVDEDECERVQAGGLVELWDIGIGDGLPVTDVLEPGDIAVVSLNEVQAGAIWTGERFAIKAARGIHFLQSDAFAVLKAWRPRRG